MYNYCNSSYLLESTIGTTNVFIQINRVVKSFVELNSRLVLVVYLNCCIVTLT